MAWFRCLCAWIKAQFELRSNNKLEIVSDGNQVESKILHNKLQNLEHKINSSVLDMKELNFMEIINAIDLLVELFLQVNFILYSSIILYYIYMYIYIYIYTGVFWE